MFGEKIMMLSMAIGLSLAPASNLISPLSGENTIYNSNVAYDLKLLYGGDNPTGFDLGSLQPQSTDYDNEFSFYCMYPYDSDLFLYLYDFNLYNYEFYDYSSFKLSFSIDQNADASFNEDWSWYQARFINSYGYRGRFAKFVIEGILDPANPCRVAIGGAEIYYTNAFGQASSPVVREINDEMDIDQTGGVNDLVYDYYSDDYVYVEDSTLAVLLTPTDDKDKVKTTIGGASFYQEYYEDFYYFFSTDDNHKMDDLIEIKYDYTYLTYDAYAFFEGSKLNSNRMVAYRGLVDQNETVDLTDYDSLELGKAWQVLLSPLISSAITSSNQKYTEKLLSSDVISTQFCVANRKNTPIYRDSINTESFWRKKEVSYTLNTIIDLSDGYDTETGEYWNQNGFTEAVQDYHTSLGNDPFEWAFLVASDTREVTDWEKQSGSEWFGHTTAHECIDTILTWLHYRTDDVDFELNALSIPSSTEAVYSDGEFFDTLGDQFITFFTAVGTATKNIFKWIGIICGSLALVIVVILIVRAVRKYRQNNKVKKAYNTGSTGSTYKKVQKDTSSKKKDKQNK